MKVITDHNRLYKEATFSATTELDSENISDEEILRLAISSELSAINLYKSLARKAKSDKIKNILLDVAEEEQVHVGEFQEALEMVDSKEFDFHVAGRKEVGSI